MGPYRFHVWYLCIFTCIRFIFTVNVGKYTVYHTVITWVERSELRTLSTGVVQFPVSVTICLLSPHDFFVGPVMKKNTTDISKSTVPKTNECPLKIDGWKMNVLLEWSLFRGHVHIRSICFQGWGWCKVILHVPPMMVSNN